MSKDVAQLILKYSREYNPTPEEIRDEFKKNYYLLHQSPLWKTRFKAMVHDNFRQIIKKGRTIEDNFGTGDSDSRLAPAFIWGKIEYDLDNDNFDIEQGQYSNTDLEKSYFHLTKQNTIIMTPHEQEQLSENEKKFTMNSCFGLSKLYFKQGTKVREFLEYVYRFGLIPQLCSWNKNKLRVDEWWLRFDILLNIELVT